MKLKAGLINMSNKAGVKTIDIYVKTGQVFNLAELGQWNLFFFLFFYNVGPP